MAKTENLFEYIFFNSFKVVPPLIFLISFLYLQKRCKSQQKPAHTKQSLEEMHRNHAQMSRNKCVYFLLYPSSLSLSLSLCHTHTHTHTYIHTHIYTLSLTHTLSKHASTHIHIHTYTQTGLPLSLHSQSQVLASPFSICSSNHGTNCAMPSDPCSHVSTPKRVNREGELKEAQT